MHTEIDLRSADFRGLSTEQQLAKCREMRGEAERLASSGSAQFRAPYTDLAKRWTDLANDIEHSLVIQNPNGNVE
jgi:hypothetical protein